MSLDVLEISNFQAHERFVVEFDPSLTTIVGPSDVGKSSILRALCWVCLNTPQGDAFIRRGSKGSDVLLKFDGRELRRARLTNGENSYSLDGVEFKAFGFSVPDTISKIVSASSTNFAGQHDPHFWFSLSAGEVSRQLNAVVDLSIIDEALESIGRRVRKGRDEVQLYSERLGRARMTFESLKWVEEADRDLTILESREEELRATSKRKTALDENAKAVRRTLGDRELANELGRESTECGRLGAAASRVSDSVSSLSEVLNSAKVLKSESLKPVPEVDQLDSKRVEVQEVFVKIKSLFETILKVKNSRAEVGLDVPDCSELGVLINTYNEKSSRASTLELLLKSAKSGARSVTSSASECEAADAELEKFTDGRCPVCGSAT